MQHLIASLTATRIKRVAVLAIPTLLLLAAIWLNRRPTFYIDRFPNQQTKAIEYRLCLVYHRWGTQVVCPRENGVNYNQAQYQLFVTEGALAESGLVKRWQWAP